MIIAQPQDVLLEPGKVSDYDSDILFWDVYFSKTQVKFVYLVGFYECHVGLSTTRLIIE